KPGVDSEARWVRKGKHYRYGYKKHVLTDEQGLVEALIRTPANCADTLVLPKLVEKSELSLGVSVLADKGYCSKKNSECLARRGLVDGIMLKASRRQVLSESQKLFNRMISKTSIRRWFLGGRCRYRGLAKTHTQNILEAMAYNLKCIQGCLCFKQPDRQKIPDPVGNNPQGRGKGEEEYHR
ncbi:transposase, partial [Porphyromonas gulae]|uniref:transposase n=1 Tax=Porphyromonas gulae TaxID=111105 RepID=UPI0012D34923